MPKVEIVALGAKHDRKDVGEIGEVVEVSENLAAAMERYGLAKPVEDKPEVDEPDENSDENSEAGENPADKREKATSDNAARRETREAAK